MIFTISDQADLRYEALCLVERFASHSSDASSMYSDLDSYCAYYLSEYGLTDPEGVQIEALCAAGRRVTEKLEISPEDLERYFKPLPDTEVTMAGALLMMHNMFGETHPGDAALIRAILTLLEIDPHSDDSVQPETFTAMAAHIAALSFSPETKWACADLFLNYGPRRTRAIELIDSAATLLEPEAAPLQAAVAACAAQLTALNSEGGLDAAFRKKGLTLDCSVCEIVPCAMRFSAISLFSTDCVSGGADHVTIRYGALFDLLETHANEQRGESDELLRFAKALADKTRVQILFALKDASLYAQDVVSLTGLTAATVSHHMSELASTGLVSLEKQGTRILYRLLPSKIERLIGLLKSLTT